MSNSAPSPRTKAGALLAWVIRRHGTGADAAALTRADPSAPEAVILPTGQRWTYLVSAEDQVADGA
ncbi:hypothetical protein [Nonomuraea glycinis]|uniref:hypothetical protein n=1 Tax=Nonomuraea glycinis TaxID=2047744 RepID=UPI002E135108|nr:hypothetical protein OHA68_00540 [Nonomuraea glycinis]